MAHRCITEVVSRRSTPLTRYTGRVPSVAQSPFPAPCSVFSKWSSATSDRRLRVPLPVRRMPSAHPFRISHREHWDTSARTNGLRNWILAQFLCILLNLFFNESWEMSTTETTRIWYLISIWGQVNYKKINAILLLLLNQFLNKSWELSTRIWYLISIGFRLTTKYLIRFYCYYLYY